MNTTVMILGLLATAVCAVSFFFKKQGHYILCLCLLNLLVLAQYIIQGYHAETGLTMLAVIRDMIFCGYAFQNAKPKWWLIVIFETLFLVTSLLLWQNWFSIFLLLSVMLTTWATWQRNMLVLRLINVVVSVLMMLNYICTGLYTTIIGEAIALMAVIVSIILYHVRPWLARRGSREPSRA